MRDITEVVSQYNSFSYATVVRRLSVPGGWVVTWIHNLEGSLSTDIHFIPDPNHEWELPKEDAEQQG